MFDLLGNLGTIASQPIFLSVEHLVGALYGLVGVAHELLHHHVHQLVRHGD